MILSWGPSFWAEVARVKNKPVLKIENKLLVRDQKLLEWGINMNIFFTDFFATCATNFGEKERPLADRRLNLIKSCSLVLKCSYRFE